MIQSFDVNLQVVMRALGEVVLPALDDADQHVKEQLQLSMVALDFMRQRLSQAGPFYRRELSDYAEMAEGAAALIDAHAADKASELQSLARAARVTLQQPSSDWLSCIAGAQALRSALTAAVEDSDGAPYERGLAELVLLASETIHLRARTWNLPFGFELRPDELPKLDE